MANTVKMSHRTVIPDVKNLIKFDAINQTKTKIIKRLNKLVNASKNDVVAFTGNSIAGAEIEFKLSFSVAYTPPT